MSTILRFGLDIDDFVFAQKVFNNSSEVIIPHVGDTIMIEGDWYVNDDVPNYDFFKVCEVEYYYADNSIMITCTVRGDYY